MQGVPDLQRFGLREVLTMPKRPKKKDVKPIPNYTGQRYPGTGGKVRSPQLNDCVDEMEARPERELETQQAGGDEPW